MLRSYVRRLTITRGSMVGIMSSLPGCGYREASEAGLIAYDLLKASIGSRVVVGPSLQAYHVEKPGIGP